MSAALAPLPLPAPLVAKAPLLAQLTDGLDSASLWWLSGYSAGLAERAVGPVLAAVPTLAVDVHEAPQLTVVYGSQTGNARRLAESLASQLEKTGARVRLVDAANYPLRELQQERYLQLVISTQGDGDPPDDARAFVDFVLGRRAPRLPDLQFAVLGLGDSSYPKFCDIGRRLDARLQELGATRWQPRAEADLDFAVVADPWIEQAVQLARTALSPPDDAADANAAVNTGANATASAAASEAPALSATVTALRPWPAAPVVDREHPFAAELLGNQRITGRGSDKDIRHLELSLHGSSLSYEPGDALGVWPSNPKRLVEEVLAALQLSSTTPVTQAGETLPLQQWLSDRRELTRLSRPFLSRLAEQTDNDELAALLTPEHAEALGQLMAAQQPIDLLHRLPAGWSAEALVTALRPLAPRLYSIASSQAAVGDEAHLTVAHVEYQSGAAVRWGAASHFLADSAEGARLPVFIERNERFRLPQDGSRDLIMIGPGTGVAPFRAFLQQRAASGATGRHWLLFGNPHFRSDFLYQLEWQRALKQGQLQRLDLAFSRDRAKKIYVQHRLREQGRELYSWLQQGAHVYVCGATQMGRDVHRALLDAVGLHGHLSPDAAEDYVNALQQQGRYARDVY